MSERKSVSPPTLLRDYAPYEPRAHARRHALRITERAIWEQQPHVSQSRPGRGKSQGLRCPAIPSIHRAQRPRWSLVATHGRRASNPYPLERSSAAIRWSTPAASSDQDEVIGGGLRLPSRLLRVYALLVLPFHRARELSFATNLSGITTRTRNLGRSRFLGNLVSISPRRPEFCVWLVTFRSFIIMGLRYDKW